MFCKYVVCITCFRVGDTLSIFFALCQSASKIDPLFIYSMIRDGEKYFDAGKDYYDQQYKERIVKNMTRRAKMLGFELTPIMECTSEVP